MTLSDRIKALPAIKDEAGAACVSREVVLGLVEDAEARIKLEILQGLRKEFEQTKEPTMLSAWVSAYKKIDEAIAAAERQMKRGSGT